MRFIYKLKRLKRLMRPSPAEKAFISIWKDMGIMWRLRYRYKREHLVSGYYLDIALPKQKIDIEIDGRFHKDVIGQWTHDQRRDRHLEDKGWVVLRFDAREVFREPEKVKYALKYFMIHGKKPPKLHKMS